MASAQYLSTDPSNQMSLICLSAKVALVKDEGW